MSFGPSTEVLFFVIYQIPPDAFYNNQFKRGRKSFQKFGFTIVIE